MSGECPRAAVLDLPQYPLVPLPLTNSLPTIRQHAVALVNVI